MKKTLRISLGGITYNIEEDAYQLLDNYFTSIKNHLKGTAGAEEIIRDIEERAGELLTSLLNGKEIVTIEMVKSVMETLGKPEQITNEDPNEGSQTGYSSTTSSNLRRLYRDTEHPIIAGVCSGLAAYANVNPLVFRIIFLVLIFAKGLGILAYIIFWIAVPRAETVRQKMEMRGEEVNFSNLEKNIRREFDEVKSNLEKQNVSSFFERIFGAMGHVFIAIGSALGVFARIIAAVFAVIFMSIGLIGLLGTVSSIFMGEIITRLFPMHTGLSLGQLLSTTFDLGSVFWVTIPAFLVVVIPFLCFILLGLRMVVRFRMRGSLIFVIVASVWIMSVMALAFATLLQARSFTIRENVKERMALTLADTKANTLTVIADETFDLELMDDDKTLYFEDYTIIKSNESLQLASKPRIYIGRAEGDSYEMILEKKSRGATHQTAKQNADRIAYKYTLVDSKLVISPYFFLPKNEKWRAQDLRITINVPEGKMIYFEKSVLGLLGSHQEYCSCWPDEMVENTWVMKNDMLQKVE